MLTIIAMSTRLILKLKIAKKYMRVDKINNMDKKIGDGSWENTKDVRKTWSAILLVFLIKIIN